MIRLISKVDEIENKNDDCLINKDFLKSLLKKRDDDHDTFQPILTTLYVYDTKIDDHEILNDIIGLFKVRLN